MFLTPSQRDTPTQRDSPSLLPTNAPLTTASSSWSTPGIGEDDEADTLHLRRLETLGRLAGAVAHDFNNLLTVILGATGSLLDAPAHEDPMQAIREIHDSAIRARQLTRQLLDAARRDESDPRPLDPSKQIEGIVGLLKRLMADRVQIEHDLPRGLPQVVIDPGHLDQIMLNLGVNARDAMGERGTLKIQTSLEAAESGQDEEHPGWVVVRVRDSGQGMDSETRDRIFEPFFTTKGKGQGTGLGLATVFAIMEEAGGRIEVESEPGEGTTFLLWFPAHRSNGGGGTSSAIRNEPAATESSGVRLPLPQARVLVVEDDPAVRRIVVRALRRSGHVVSEAGAIADALRLHRSNTRPFDLLITDVILPDGSGVSLLSEMETDGRPGSIPPTILMSGYAKDEAGPLGPHADRVHFLPKPFLVDELNAAVIESITPEPD